MFTIVQQIIGYASGSSYNDTSTILAVCAALVCLFSVVFIDIIKDIIGSLIR